MQYAVINMSDTKNIPLKGFVTIGIAGDSSPLHRVSLEIATCRNRLDTFFFTQAHLSFFLARPSCNCHRLCLHNIAVTDNELVTRLQGLPSLTIYRISRESVTDGHRARMTHDISGSSVLGSALLVPSLKQLNCITQFGLDDQIILDVVQSRWKPSKYNI